MAVGLSPMHDDLSCTNPPPLKLPQAVAGVETDVNDSVRFWLRAWLTSERELYALIL